MTISKGELAERADQIVRSGQGGDEARTRESLTSEEEEALSIAAKKMMGSLTRILISSSPFLRSITQGELVVLMAIGVADHALTPMELSNEVALTRPRITQILDALGKKGLIVRERDAKDQRKIHVSLSEEGQELVQLRIDTMAALLENHLLLLGHDDTESLARILDETATIIEGYDLTSSSELLTL